MTNIQKLNSLKKKLIAENDKKYGQEVKQRWGEEVWEKSNEKFKNMTRKQFDSVMETEKEFKKVLLQAFETRRPDGELAQTSVELHKKWLTAFWPKYSKEAHFGLANMYVEDIRFHHYFNDSKELAEFFRKAVSVFVKQ